jgi:hypothetical protein
MVEMGYDYKLKVLCQLQKTRYYNFVWNILCSVGDVQCIVVYA